MRPVRRSGLSVSDLCAQKNGFQEGVSQRSWEWWNSNEAKCMAGRCVPKGMRSSLSRDVVDKYRQKNKTIDTGTTGSRLPEKENGCRYLTK